MTNTEAGHKVTATIGRAAWHFGQTGTVVEVYMDGEMAVVAYETTDNGRVTVKLPTAILARV